jgi:hypothetical protein
MQPFFSPNSNLELLGKAGLFQNLGQTLLDPGLSNIRFLLIITVEQKRLKLM